MTSIVDELIEAYEDQNTPHLKFLEEAEKRFETVKAQILENQEKAEKWTKIVEHEDFAEYLDCMICKADIQIKTGECEATCVRGGALGTVCNECQTRLENGNEKIIFIEKLLMGKSIDSEKDNYYVHSAVRQILDSQDSREVEKK